MKNVVKAASFLMLLLIGADLSAQTNIWKVRRSPLRQDLLDVAFGEGTFVAVGEHATILSSPEGKNWTVRSFGTNAPNDYTGVAYGNGVFVAVGNGPRQIRTSPDGVNWGTPQHGAIDLYDITFAKGRFVAVGEAILTSIDGTNWTRARRIGLAKTIAFGEGRFVVLDEDDRIWTSRNGVSWTNRLVELAGTFTDMTFNGTDFIASAVDTDAIYMYSSPGGVNWTPSAPTSFLVNGLARVKDIIVAVGEHPDAVPPGRLQLSADGLTWPGDPVQVARPLYAVTYGRGTIVAVGKRGLIVQAHYADVVSSE